MTALFFKKNYIILAGIFRTVFSQPMQNNGNRMIFVFNVMRYTGGDGYEILLNPGKEVISF